MSVSSFKDAPRSATLAVVMSPEEMIQVEGPRALGPEQDHEFGSRLKGVVAGLMSLGALNNEFTAKLIGRALCAAHPRTRLPLIIGIIRDDPDAFDRMFESLSKTSNKSDRIARFNLATTLGSFARHCILIDALKEERLDEIADIMQKIRRRKK